METSLIAELSKFGPLALLGGMALIVYRDEVRAMLGAGKREREVEGALQQIAALFQKNLTYFEALSKQAEKWVEAQDETTAELKALHETQRSILNEMVRGVTRRGG